MTGVESAVRIHINRGDDINARDGKGQTPLMLAAAYNNAAICELLLVAGADPGLLDDLGRTALDIAQAARAVDAASTIQAACMSRKVARDEDGSGDPAACVVEDPETPVAGDAPAFHRVAISTGEPDWVSNPAPEVAPATPDAGWVVDDRSGFDLTGWEAEADPAPPEGDPAVAAAAVEVQSAITGHQPVDTSAGWDDFETFLPDRAAALLPADDLEARERLRLVLLRAVREGSVPHSALEDLTHGDDGEPDMQAGALLHMVINDLGAETDERFEYSAPHESFEVFVPPDGRPDEEDKVAEALAFLGDLTCGHNEPLRIYQREFQREALLSAEVEVALGQAMERGIHDALDALAAWPSGIAAVLDAAREVMSGSKPPSWMSSGAAIGRQKAEDEPGEELEADIEPELPEDGEDTDAEDESGFHVAPEDGDTSGELAEFCANAELLSGLAVAAGRDAPGWGACRDSLASLGLTPGFLMQLADSGLTGETEPALAFRRAVRAYRQARDRMTVANLKLVFSIARKYLYSGQPLDDLLQEGNIGLIMAVDRYDWRKGFRFSTYATWWIRQRVGRYVADKGRIIRLPVHLHQKTRRIAQVAHAFELRHGRPPTPEETASLVDLPARKVAVLSRIGLEPLPLHDLHDIDDLVTADARDRFTLRDPMEIVEDIQLGQSVDRFLSTLKLKEAGVLRMRHGIGIQDSMTLEEIGVRLEVTRERIRQIEGRALRRLRHPARLDRFLNELGLAPAPGPEQSAEEPGDADDDGEGVVVNERTNAAAPEPKPPAPAVPRPERRADPAPSALDKLLDHARNAGIVVEDHLEGSERRLWVHITKTPDKRSRWIVRKLIELGFELWPGKGYWR